MNEWHKISIDSLPIERDRWYLFGGYDKNNEWVFDKYHYDLDGRVNGWNIHTLLNNGNTHWMLPEPPK